jgi:hypothetical protein
MPQKFYKANSLNKSHQASLITVMGLTFLDITHRLGEKAVINCRGFVSCSLVIAMNVRKRSCPVRGPGWLRGFWEVLGSQIS